MPAVTFSATVIVTSLDFAELHDAGLPWSRISTWYVVVSITTPAPGLYDNDVVGIPRRV